MKGHFEKGKWIEDEPKQLDPMSIDVIVHVDNTEIKKAIEDIERANEQLRWLEHLTTRLACNKYPKGFWQRLRWLITGKVK